MPKRKILIDKSELEMRIEAQASIVSGYDVKTEEGQCALAVEQHSAEFLENYLEGRLVLSDEAAALLPQYFEVLKVSKYGRIKSNVGKAELEFKRKVMEDKKQKEKVAIDLKRKAIEENKQQERAKYWMDTQFNILSKKKEVQKLSSADLLLIGKLIKEEKGYSTKRNQDRLRSIIGLRIAKTLNGEIQADADFIDLVDKYGTIEQRRKAIALFGKVNTQIPEIVDEPIAKEPKTNKNDVELIAVGEDKNIFIPADKNNSEVKSVVPNGKVATPNNKKGEPSNKKQESKIKGWWKKVWQKVKRPVLILGVAALGFFGVRSAFNDTSSDKQTDNQNFNPTEQVVEIAEEPTTPVNATDNQNPVSEKDQAYNLALKNRFDTALSLHIGNAERDKLYQKIEALEQAGKIKFENGTTKEWYAYAFTILNKVAPYSTENSVVKTFLNGGNVDAKYINDLVIKINPRGTGIKGNGTHSAYDNAPSDIQKKHREALKTFNLLDAERDM